MNIQNFGQKLLSVASAEHSAGIGYSSIENELVSEKLLVIGALAAAGNYEGTRNLYFSNRDFFFRFTYPRKLFVEFFCDWKPPRYKFHYCSYWGTWSRRLADGPSYVEVNLTPIPSCFSSSWEKDVFPIRIRQHGTTPARRDEDTNYLPMEVVREIRNKCGVKLTERLLNEDFLPQIDWSKYHRVDNGGANLADIKKD